MDGRARGGVWPRRVHFPSRLTGPAGPKGPTRHRGGPRSTHPRWPSRAPPPLHVCRQRGRGGGRPEIVGGGPGPSRLTHRVGPPPPIAAKTKNRNAPRTAHLATNPPTHVASGGSRRVEGRPPANGVRPPWGPVGPFPVLHCRRHRWGLGLVLGASVGCRLSGFAVLPLARIDHPLAVQLYCTKIYPWRTTRRGRHYTDDQWAAPIPLHGRRSPPEGGWQHVGGRWSSKRCGYHSGDAASVGGSRPLPNPPRRLGSFFRAARALPPPTPVPCIDADVARLHPLWLVSALTVGRGSSPWIRRCACAGGLRPLPSADSTRAGGRPPAVPHNPFFLGEEWGGGGGVGN